MHSQRDDPPAGPSSSAESTGENAEVRDILRTSVVGRAGGEEETEHDPGWEQNPLFRGHRRGIVDSAASSALGDPDSRRTSSTKQIHDPPSIPETEFAQGTDEDSLKSNIRELVRGWWKRSTRKDGADDCEEESVGGSECRKPGQAPTTVPLECEIREMSLQQGKRNPRAYHGREDSDVLLNDRKKLEKLKAKPGSRTFAEKTPRLSHDKKNVGVDRDVAGMGESDSISAMAGKWELDWDKSDDSRALGRVLDVDKTVMKERRDESLLRVDVDKDGKNFRTKTKIVGLYNVKVPLDGNAVDVPRCDGHEGTMRIHAEKKYAGLLTISTWEHPLAGTRRENYEIAGDLQELIVTTYVTRRDGDNCRVRWIFYRNH